MSVTQEELAAHLNLHRGSVARILSGRGNGYSEQTKRRVLEAAAEMGYQPNHLARSLATGATKMVALWVPDQGRYSPYYSYIHYCLLHQGVQNGYQLLSEDARKSLHQPDPQLNRWPVDGILACDMMSEVIEHQHSKLGRLCPVVFLGQTDTAEMDCIHLDFNSGAREAVEHLLAVGCRRIAFVGPVMDHDDRVRAYNETMDQAGKPTEHIKTSNGSRTAGYEVMREYLAEHAPPDGLFCVNDEIAIGCYTALLQAGVHVPEDVLLVGFDGLENARLSPCPISSVVVPIEEMSTLAWEMLRRRIEDPQAPLQHRTFVPRLEVRASSIR